MRRTLNRNSPHERNKVAATYDHAKYLKQRIDMMQCALIGFLSLAPGNTSLPWPVSSLSARNILPLSFAKLLILVGINGTRGFQEVRGSGILLPPRDYY
jgi:hypothetical protein